MIFLLGNLAGLVSGSWGQKRYESVIPRKGYQLVARRLLLTLFDCAARSAWPWVVLFMGPVAASIRFAVPVWMAPASKERLARCEKTGRT